MNQENIMSLPSAEDRSKLKLTDLLPAVLDFACANQYSIALWKLPAETKQRLLISKKTTLIKREDALEEMPAGFVFSPFERTKQSIFLEADYCLTFIGGMLSEHCAKTGDVGRDLLTALPRKPSTPRFYSSRSTGLRSLEKDDFIELVDQAINEIARGNAEKIVPSRVKHIARPADFDIGKTFQALCDQYPDAMVTFVSTRESGSWIGATPELLVCVKDAMFKTVALAGTQSYNDGTSVKNVAWTQKEIEEQALVERYIISCFKKIRLREYDEHGPKTVVAGNVMHLRSDFTVDMIATGFPQLGSVMLQLLHPTSAVCGMPLDQAKSFLDANEKYDRAYYSGYLGPVNMDRNEVHIFVNLRCMQLQDETIILYAGAGVTADSIAEKEWDETEMKMNSLLRILTPSSKP